MRAALSLLTLFALAGCKAKPYAPSDSDLDIGPRRQRPASSRHQPDAGPAGPGTFRFTVSGERFARAPYPFPPVEPGGPAFVDGWELRIDHLLVALDHIALYEEPDKSADDPTQVGAKVAEATGPWVVDLHRPGPSAGTSSEGGIADEGALDAGSVETPIGLANLLDQTLAGRAPFDATKRYAVSYDVVRAANGAQLVNLDVDGMSEFINMVSGGYSVYYIGVATWKGTAATCGPSDPTFDFIAARFTTEVTFKLGFKTPTTYLNCQNPELARGRDRRRAPSARLRVTEDSETAVYFSAWSKPGATKKRSPGSIGRRWALRRGV